MKYSIIVPVYNAEKYLKKCIESVLLQSRNDFELILVDDCSKDSSLEICKDYQLKDSRVKLFSQEVNRGVSAARNLGIENSAGEFILFLDSDDYVAESYLETIDDFAGKCDLFSFGYNNCLTDANGKITTECGSMLFEGSTESGDYLSSFFMKSFFSCPWNKLYRKDIIIENNIRFDTQCVCFEDYIFNLDYCKCISSYKSISAPLYYYRQYVGVNSISRRNWGEKYLISKKVAQKTNDVIAQFSDDPEIEALRRYTYAAFMTEFRAIKLQNPDADVSEAANELLSFDDFRKSLPAVYNAGFKSILVKAALSLHLNFLFKFILK